MTSIDLALLSGRVRTLDPDRPEGSAIAIAGGTIVAVGDDAQVRALCGRATEVVDLEGAAVVPGIIDSHLHPFLGAVGARGADLMNARSLDDVNRLVAQERARCAPHEWVLGFGLDYNVFEHTGIHGELIEPAAGGGPALLTFSDFHTALATPRALALAGVDGPRAFVEHAEVVCVDGVPTGELREAAAMALVRDAIPVPGAPERYRLCARQLRRLAAVGITGAHAMDGDLATLDLLRELEANGDLVTRLVTPFWITPETTEDEWRAFVAHRDARGRRWRAGVAKFFIDGVIDSGTGWLVEPDIEGAGRAAFWPDPARYRKAVRLFARHSFQCVTHATGDRGVREALDAYREAGAAPGVRHRIEHIETLQPNDLPRFAAEGVVASMQAQHMMWLAPDHSDNWSRRLGSARCERAFLIRSLHESGAVVALGSDWPVARFDPREGLAAARLRRPPSRPDRQPYDDQALDGLAALEGYTKRAALAVGDDDRLGRIRVGFCADLTVFGSDPVDCDPDELPADPVLMTVVDGEIVFRHAEMQP
jgi:predicted amidohydrolase YtcJ